MTRLALLRVATLPFGTLAALAARDVAARAETVLAASRSVDRESTALADRLFAAAGRYLVSRAPRT